MITVFLLSLLAGALAGLLAGLFGIGGGLVLVPLLALLFAEQKFPSEISMIMAVATSLATIVITSTSSIIAHHRLGSVLWSKVFRLAPGIMLGASLGATVADFVSAEALRYFFAGFLAYVGLQMALQIRLDAPAMTQSPGQDFWVGSGIGMLSALLGIGGGTLTVPYLVGGRYPIRNAVAVASACGFPIALSGTVSYALLGWGQAGLPEWSLGYIYMPAFIGIVMCSVVTAPLGAKLAHILPAQQLKRYFSVLVFLMAVKLIWD